MLIVSVKYIDLVSTDMAMMQADYFSGHCIADLDKVRAQNPPTKGIKRIDDESGGIAFYIDEIGPQRICVSFATASAL